MSLFSVIIPLYNKEKYIETTLKSVLNQDFKDFEVIIFDDGSTDEGLKKVEAFNDQRIIICTQKNKGVSITRNNAINRAKGKYMALIDADDFWTPNHLSELKKLINTFPDAGLYCNNYQVIYNNKVAFPAKFNFKYGDTCLIVDDFFKASIINCVAWTSSVCFSKGTFLAIGGFKTHLKTAQDLDLWIRLALNYKIAFNPTTTMHYKLYVKNSLSKSEDNFNSIRYDFISSFAEFERTNPSLKLYLDINRYSVALRSLVNNNQELYKKLKQEIAPNNLNLKQKLLLNSPKPVLILFRKFQKFLLRNNIYLTAYE